jgi:LPXTG-site transpeptidase (sortase) family protein
MRRACAAVAGLLAGLGMYALTGIAFAPGSSPAPFERLDPRAASLQGVSMDAVDVDSTPVRLVIPAIKVDATIESRGLDSSRNLDTPRDYRNVAWYNLGPRPGQAGNAIINGHVNWWTGDAVFTHLSRLRAGDTIRVFRADGSTVVFKVEAKQVVDANARLGWLFDPSSSPSLVLITCSGVWNPLTQSDTQRLLVKATLA